MLTNDEILELTPALLLLKPGDRLGFLAGIMIRGLRREGFDWRGIVTEFSKAVEVAEHVESAASDETAICAICTTEVSTESIEAPCEYCGLDGCCAECMAEHECEGA